MSENSTPIVPCENFEPDSGCSVWCTKGDSDCCVLCCRRYQCAKEKDGICPKARKILEMEEFKNKIYPWEENRPRDNLCRNCGRPRETGSQIFFECPVDGKWHGAGDRCIFKLA